MERALCALLAGTVFGAGLTISQMVNPDKVLAFLDFAGKWDPSLMFVMGGAVVVGMIGFYLVRSRDEPLFGAGFDSRHGLRIDGEVVMGSAIFGVGWGLSGYCPGPAIASVALLNRETLFFLPAMFAGFALWHWVSRASPGFASAAR
jgi:uncharacterized protein